MSYDVFSDENKVKGNWFQKKVAGNTLQGTFIGKEQRPNFLAGGRMDWVYEIRTNAGEIWFVQGNAAIDAQMKHVKVGQIVGFKYMGESTKSRPGQSPAKIVQVFANPKLVDEAWLQEQEEVGRVTTPNDDDIEGGPNGIDVASIPMGNDTPVEPRTDTDALNLIGELAKSKLGVTDANDVKLKVMEATNLAFIPSNYERIIDALRALPTK